MATPIEIRLDSISTAVMPVFNRRFRTFRNSRNHEHETSFYAGASNRVVDMLLFKDINKNPPERTALTAG